MNHIAVINGSRYTTAPDLRLLIRQDAPQSFPGTYEYRNGARGTIFLERVSEDTPDPSRYKSLDTTGRHMAVCDNPPSRVMEWIPADCKVLVYPPAPGSGDRHWIYSAPGVDVALMEVGV